jgi:hypothetical protein
MRPEPDREGPWSPHVDPDSQPRDRAPSGGPLGPTEWTTDIPSVPGWYWLRHAVFQTALGQWHEPHPVVVELVPDATGQLLVYVTGTTWTRSVVDLIVGEWSGPLAVPE